MSVVPKFARYSYLKADSSSQRRLLKEKRQDSSCKETPPTLPLGKQGLIYETSDLLAAQVGDRKQISLHTTVVYHGHYVL